MQLSVVKNAKRNMALGTINKLIVIVCPFITRMLIKRLLSIKYLGLSSLFGSILDVISLSELGFSSAILYFMYKPLSNNDTKTVNALLNFCKKAYRIIGLAIIIFGLCVIPFINNFIKDEIPDNINIYYIYLVYVVNSAASYFLYAYMSSIIVVNQRDDINSIVNSISMISLTTLQVVLLYFTRNYYLFITLMPIFTVVGNIWIAVIVKKQFPMYRAEGQVPKEMFSRIKKVVAGAFIQKSCGTTRNSVDSICISSFIGIAATGIYNNYFMIIKGIMSFQSVFSNSLVGGIGNHVATKSIDENFQELKKLDFVYLNITGWCMTFLLCLYQPFMRVWMGNDALLPFRTVVLLCLYYYFLEMGEIRCMYITTNGLFWEHRWRSIVETVANVGLNIVLGKFFGIDGIIIATMISIFICNFIWANKITFKKYFGKSYLKDYYLYQLKYFIINVCVCGLTMLICSSIGVSNGILGLFMRMLLCAIIPGLIYFSIYRRDIESIKKILFR